MVEGVRVRSRKSREEDTLSVSIVITAHNEATILGKAVESCRRALAQAKGYSSNSEIIIVCDRPTAKTRELAMLLAEGGRVNAIYITDFGDPSLARNLGAQKASGHFLTFVDGDDLISSNYINLFVLRAANLKGDFLRPQIILTFDQEKAFLVQFGSREIPNAEIMIYSNPWAMPVFGRRQDFLALPFPGDDKKRGFSHEDWEWNLHVLNAGVHFEIVDEVVYFARRRRSSRTEEARQFQYVIRPQDFFRNKCNFASSDLGGIYLNEVFKSKYVGKLDKAGYLFADQFYMRDLREGRAHSALDHYMRFGRRDNADARRLHPEDEMHVFVKNAIIESMVMLSDIEGKLDPFSYWSHGVMHYDLLVEDRSTTLWTRILNTGIFDEKWDVVFALPWVRRGGADLVALKHIQACIDLGLRVCILTTLDHAVEWSERIPEGVFILPFGHMAGSASLAIQVEVFHRLLIELRAGTLHNVNSGLFWNALERNGLSIHSTSKVVCSLYCQDFNAAGSSVGYDRYIDACDPFIDAYVTDNTVYAGLMSQQLGVAPDKITTIKYPIETGRVNTSKRTFRQNRKILWASRLDHQKGIDILNRVSRNLSDVEFHFYGEAMLNSFDLEDLALPMNQVYRGKFAHIEEINPEEFDAFLYTARWDGLPNIVLEMGMKRLPILSFVTGGLSDVIRDETAWPIPEVSVAAVVQAIRSFYAAEDMGRGKAVEMLNLLTSEHSPETFAEQCATLYMTRSIEASQTLEHYSV